MFVFINVLDVAFGCFRFESRVCVCVERFD